MKPYRSIILVALVLALVQTACSLPAANTPTEMPEIIISTPTSPPVVTATQDSSSSAATATIPPVVTATPNPDQPTRTAAPTQTESASTDSGQSCTYLAAFVADVTIPDNSQISPGASFTKTWRVRNDGTCTWGPDKALHALAFTGGSKLGAPDQVSLPGAVQPGQMIDISVNMVAPAEAGTYTSEWKFLVKSGSSNQYVGLGAAKTYPLFAKIKVGAVPTPIASTRINFASGATTAAVDGQVSAGATKSFILSAQKDQLLMASFTSAASDLRMRILQASNQAEVVQVTGAIAQAFLPANGDYLIQIIGGSQDASFTLSVTIPQRIKFASGAVSASVDGKISNHNQVAYLLRAMKGQTMTAAITSNSELALTIYGLDDGQPLVRSQAGVSTWTGTLPATQDYVIMVVPAVDSATFTLTTTVK